MKFRGLFIGIDRYQSSGINWLSSAVRDATALHAIFADTLGHEAALLTSEAATGQRIQEELSDLAKASTTEDLVVVAFSGHGSRSHALIPYDADRARPDQTFLPLDEFAKLLNQIPAATLVCILDCCFSGGYGAKVLLDTMQARELASESDVLDQIAGNGRIVLTASAANEPAYEHNALGHGLLTYHLLAGLKGAPEAVSAGKIDVYKLVHHVTRQVIDASTARGRAQHPTLRGTIDGLPSWPIFRPGATYAAAFPERVRQPATKQVHSLEAFGLPSALLATWAQEIPELNELQLAAVNEYGVLDGANLLVTAPTSSGKTMVGELAALQRAVDRRRALFLLPMRALVNDKYAEFSRKYGDLGIVTIRSTGEISDDNAALMSGRYDICLMTYEKFGMMVLANPHLLHEVGTIVVDEVQMMVDPNRGANLEFILTLLKSRRAQQIEPQVICLSAVIGDTGGLERWLDGRQLRHDERPVPLIEGVLTATGDYRFLDERGLEKTERILTPEWSGKNSSQDLVIPLVAKLVREGKQVIVFREIKGETIGCAEYLAYRLGLPSVDRALGDLPVGDLSTSSERLRRVLSHGVAFHNADLDRLERQVIEEEFRRPDTTLRVLISTTTLAMGINTPASAVVIVGLTHPGNVPYTVAEYKNMVGRAGRLGYTARGESYLIASRGLDTHRLWSQYVRGKPEDIRSVFLDQGSDPRTLILRTLAALEPGADGSVEAQLLVSFLESSFGAYQRRQTNPSWSWGRDAILQMLRELAVHQLIEATGRDGYRLTDLGRFTGESGVLVDSIIRLIELLRPQTLPLNSTSLIAAAQVTRELDEGPYISFNKRGVNTEHQRWPRLLAQQEVSGVVLNRIGIGGRDALTRVSRSKKAAACVLYTSHMPLADIERLLTQHQREDGGVAGAIRQIADRTRDLLPTVSRVFEYLHPEVAPSDITDRTMVRLELGIPADLVDLGTVLGSRLSRAQYLVLLQRGMTTAGGFVVAEADSLAEALRLSRAQAAELQAIVRSAQERAAIADPLDTLPPPSE